MPLYLPKITKKRKSNDQQSSTRENQFQIPLMNSNYIPYPTNPYTYPQMYDCYNYNTSYDLYPAYNSITEFLQSLGETFLEYETNFVENGYSVEELPYLNMSQLQSIGITKLGHCTRILVALGLSNF